MCKILIHIKNVDIRHFETISVIFNDGHLLFHQITMYQINSITATVGCLTRHIWRDAKN